MVAGAHSSRSIRGGAWSPAGRRSRSRGLHLYFHRLALGHSGPSSILHSYFCILRCSFFNTKNIILGKLASMSYTSTFTKLEPPPHGCEPYHSLCCLAKRTRMILEHFFGNSPTKTYVSTIRMRLK